MNSTPQTSEEVVEAVARAIYDATHAVIRNCYAWDDAWEPHQEATRGRYYKEARAAIAAMPSIPQESDAEVTEAIDEDGLDIIEALVADATAVEGVANVHEGGDYFAERVIRRAIEQGNLRVTAPASHPAMTSARDREQPK